MISNKRWHTVAGALLLTGMITAAVEAAAPIGETAPLALDDMLAPELEPEVTIIETPTAMVTSYRVKGQVYLVKIKPVRGAAYYLVDSNGDGILDMQQPEVSDLTVPQWLLFRW